MSSVKVLEVDQLIPKFVWKCKGPRIVNTTFKIRNKVGGFTSLFQNLLQNQDSNQHSVVWHKERHRSTEQNKESKNKPLQLWSVDFQQKCKGRSMEKEKIISTNYVGKSGW